MRRATVLLACASVCWGCNQVFGLEETTGMPTASLTLNSVWIETEARPALIDMSATKVSYDVVDNGVTTQAMPTATSPNTWQLEAPSRVELLPRYTVPGEPVERILSLPTRVVSHVTYFVGRRVEDPAGPSDALRLAVTLGSPYAATDSLGWLALGAWVTHRHTVGLPIAGTRAFAPPALPLPMTTSLVLQRPPSKIVATDPVVVTHHDINGTLIGYLLAQPTFTGTEASVTGTLTPMTYDQQFRLVVDAAGAASRMTAARPGYPAPAINLTLTAAPGAGYGVSNGVVLASRNAPTGMMDLVSLEGNYGNPFVAQGWASALALSIISTRTYGTVPLAAGWTWTGNNLNDGATVAMSACLPIETRVQNIPLDTDGKTITIDRNGRVDVSFSADSTASTAAQIYRVELREIVAGQAVPVRRAIAIGAEPKWSLPADLFKPGSLYVIHSECVVGIPRVGEGDAGTRQLPLIAGFAASGVFTVGL